MASNLQGPKVTGTGATVSRSQTVWTNPTNIQADDTSYATSAVPTDYLVATNFSFSIPADATIKGVLVDVWASEAGSGSSNFIPQLVSAATPTLIGTAKTAVTVSTTTITDYPAGGATDVWGASLTPSTINSTGFGVAIWSDDTVNTLSVDYITITVYYENVLAGVGATGAVGTLTPSQRPVLQSVSATGAVGTLGMAHVKPVDGVAATGEVGSLTLSTTLALAGVAASSAVGSVTPSAAAGKTLYYVIGPSAGWTDPTAAQVKSGLLGGGGPATASGSEASPTSSQTFTFSSAATGLTASTSYKVAIVWSDGTLNSNVAVSDAWVTTGGAITLSGVVATGAVGSLSPSLTLTLSGVVATGSVGAFTLAHSRTLAGVEGTGAVGSLQPSDSVSLAGSAATGAVGTFSLSHARALVGVEASGATGALTPSIGAAVVLTGVEATGSVGALALAHSRALAGAAATGSVGTFTLAHSRALAGVAATGSVGALAPADSLALAGSAATGAVGTFTLAHSRALTGVAATGATGTLTPTIGAAILLTGVEATGAVGALSLAHSRALAGVAATGSVGLLSPAVSTAIAGVSATSAVGLPTPAHALQLLGLVATGSVGDLGITTPVLVPLGGVEALGSVGDLTPESTALTRVRPDADDITGAWLPSTPAAALYSMIDEEVLDDGDFIYTETASTCRISLGAMSDPGVNTGHKISYRIKGNGSASITVRLGASSTTVATWNYAPAPASITTYVQTLSSGEVDTWRANNGYSNGWLEFEAA